MSLKEIRKEIEKLGVTTGAPWTMTADAKLCRESLAIEKAIRDNPAEREAWVKRQRKVELMTAGVLEGGEAGDDEE